jgi:hypothetical protein
LSSAQRRLDGVDSRRFAPQPQAAAVEVIEQAVAGPHAIGRNGHQAPDSMVLD